MKVAPDLARFRPSPWAWGTRCFLFRRKYANAVHPHVHGELYLSPAARVSWVSFYSKIWVAAGCCFSGVFHGLLLCGRITTVGAEKNKVIVVWSANPKQVPTRKKDRREEVKGRTVSGKFGLAILCDISAPSWPGGFIYRGTPYISPL